MGYLVGLEFEWVIGGDNVKCVKMILNGCCYCG
jgi:hypothetical protein